MLPERLEANDHPFEYLKREILPIEYRITDGGRCLEILGLNVECNADEVRRVAVTMRAQMREKGLNIESVKALEWALRKTNDCQDAQQFLRFLLDDYSFESVESSRNW